MRFVVLAALVGCTASAPKTGVPYLDDRDQRRDELEHTLADPSNGYSQLRLSNYALASGGWDALPVASSSSLDLDIDPLDPDALRALGERAFFAFPVQRVPSELAGSGIVELDDGSLAATCSTCHASMHAGALVPGLGNEQLDLGRAMVEAGEVAPNTAAAHLAWGPGRVDVTTIAGTEPVRIPDLRAVQLLTFLQADADVAQLDVEALAIRLETLMITSMNETSRPPRIVALALATYVRSLADSFAPVTDTTSNGAMVFAANCAGCHAPPAFTGDPVPLDVVGTDPIVGDSAVRGTGSYRVPSLRGVSARALLLHDGSLPSLDAMFDPRRTGSEFTGGVRPGAVPGHVFGLDLDDGDRADLLAYLEAL